MLNERLKFLRSQKAVKQSEIAKYLGIDRTTYSKYETGDSKPDYALLNKIAKYFNTSTDYLLGRTDIKEPISDKQQNEVDEILEILHKRPEMKVLFSISKKATKEDIEKTVKIIEALKGE